MTYWRDLALMVLAVLGVVAVCAFLLAVVILLIASFVVT